MNVDLETVKKQYILCKQLIQSMGSASNKIMKTYMSAGAAWHDEHYKKLGSILQECSESLLKTILQISDKLQGLESVMTALQEYDSINFSGGGGQGGNTSTLAGGRSIVSSPRNSVANVMSAGAEWCNSLSEAERSAVSAYTGEAYRNINSALRGRCNFEAGNLERARAIHSALSRASIPQDCIVYRGTNPNALGSYANYSDSELVGCCIRESGFMSTSLNRRDAFGGEVQLEISVPAGSHGAYIGNISQMGHNESEVLFDEGCRYEITEVRRDFFGNRTICARMYVEGENE